MWKGIYALAFLGAAALLIALSPELRSALQLWSEGKAVGHRYLWGHTILVWGRAGKFAQFLAGLVVILDLLSPEDLRARGASARQRLASDRARWKSRARAIRALRLSVSLRDSLFYNAYHEVPGMPADGLYPPFVIESKFRRTGSVHFKRKVRRWFSADELERFVQEVRAEVDGVPEWLIGRRVSHLADIFIEEHLSSGDFAELSDISRAKNDQVKTATEYAVVGYLCVAIGWLLLVWNNPLGRVAFPAGIAAILMSLLIVIWPGLAIYRILRLVRILWVAWYNAIAVTLDRARPGHVLRWIGLYLFIAGFSFDMLAA